MGGKRTRRMYSYMCCLYVRYRVLGTEVIKERWGRIFSQKLREQHVGEETNSNENLYV